jgi:hypothetical protein
VCYIHLRFPAPGHLTWCTAVPNPCRLPQHSIVQHLLSPSLPGRLHPANAIALLPGSVQAAQPEPATIMMRPVDRAPTAGMLGADWPSDCGGCVGRNSLQRLSDATWLAAWRGVGALAADVHARAPSGQTVDSFKEPSTGTTTAGIYHGTCLLGVPIISSSFYSCKWHTYSA